MRSIYDLTTAEAYQLLTGHFGHELPSFDAIDSADWGRDFCLQYFLRHSDEELARAGVNWQEPEELGP
jgi:hypothetical protein